MLFNALLIRQQISQQMESKMHRYMQRIEQLMGTPKRSATPARPSHSPLSSRTHQLDKYLKFQLSTKIINSVITKKNSLLLNGFFSAIRTCEYRQKERIYKFVAIQKKQEHLHIDTSISGKIMAAVLKQLLKKRRSWGFSAIKEETNNFSILKNQQGSKSKAAESEKPFKLMRSLTKPEKPGKKQVTQWVDDAPSLAEKQSFIKKIEQLKRYTLKSVLKFASNKMRRHLEWSFKNINIHILSKQVKKLAQNEGNSNKITITVESEQHLKTPKAPLSPFKLSRNQTEVLNSKITKTTNPQSFNTSVMKNQSKISRFDEEQILPQFQKPNQLYYFALKQYTKKKSAYLSQFKGLMNSTYMLRQNKNKLLKKTKGIIIIDRFGYRRILNIFNAIQYKPSKNIQLQKSKDQLLADSRISKINSSKLSISQASHFNSVAKLNFYSFVDKIFKVILIISKLLIPMKEAFVQIDKYASFSFRIEESLKIIPTKQKMSCFEQIKRYADKKSKMLNSPIKNFSPSEGEFKF